jgi:hypothetical protein
VSRDQYYALFPLFGICLHLLAFRSNEVLNQYLFLRCTCTRIGKRKQSRSRAEDSKVCSGFWTVPRIRRNNGDMRSRQAVLGARLLVTRFICRYQCRVLLVITKPKLGRNKAEWGLNTAALIIQGCFVLVHSTRRARRRHEIIYDFLSGRSSFWLITITVRTLETRPLHLFHHGHLSLAGGKLRQSKY